MYSARVVLVHLSSAGAPLVTRATPEGTTSEHTLTHSLTQLTVLLSLELALIMGNDRVNRGEHMPWSCNISDISYHFTHVPGVDMLSSFIVCLHNGIFLLIT